MYQIGATLEGRFKLVNALGEGATGTVWLAKDHKLGIDVAVKVMQATLRGDNERRAAFEREAELCARMLSPHIVRVLSWGVTTSSDVPYIVYEALEGEPLDTRLAARKRLSLDETEEIVVHVARALARAHSMGIVHKDIKPGNVFMTKDDRGRTLAKVLDFGIAEVALPHATIAGEISGTPEYMPLEVFRGAPADARADLFALAVLAYECLAGVVPYVGETVMDAIDALSGAPPSLTRAFSEEASYPLDAWMHRGLAPDAGRRFQSARDLAESFHEAIKQAKGVLGLIPPASSRKQGQQGERIVSPNSVDTVSQPPRPAPPRPSPPRPPPPRPPPPRPPPPREVAAAEAPRKPPVPRADALRKIPEPPPMRPRMGSFVFDEDGLVPPRSQDNSAGTLVEHAPDPGTNDKRRE